MMISIRLPIHIEAIMPPHQLGLLLHHLRSRHDAVNGHGADHQRHHRIGRNAERQQRE